MAPVPTLILLGFVLGACARAPESGEVETPMEPAERIVVLGPSTAANLFAMGQGERVVGVSDYCTVPEAEGVARVGGLADPSLERILSLQPDLVLVQGKAPRLEDLCRSADIDLQAFTTDTLEEWHAEVEWLARRLDAEAAGAALQARMQEGLAALGPHADQGAAGSAADGAGPSVLLVIFRREEEASGLMVAGDQGFLHELLVAAGGANVLAGNGRDYFDLNEERLIRAAPEWILEFHTEDLEPEERAAREAEALRVWGRDFPSLPAVEAGRVRTLQGQDLLLPGPSMLETAQQMHALLRTE